MKRVPILFLRLLCSYALMAQTGQSPADIHREQENLFVKDSMDEYIQRGLEDWNLPGLSVVIVKDGKTVFMKGYGVRDIVSKAPVDCNTLFMIASNTKLFTASSLALLETRGKISFNARVTQYFPRYGLALSAYTGIYTNALYGKIRIDQQKNQLVIHFDIKPDLTATLDYLDHGNWLLTYNNIEYGIFTIQFAIQNKKVKSITTKQNPYVEYDPYLFTKD